MTTILLVVACAGPPGVDFQRDIAPLIAKRCLECHSGADPRGKLDLSRKASALEVITPGKPGASGLFRRVRDGKMPPKKPLPEEERELLRRWIEAGAPWHGDIDPFRATTDHRAGHDWWSLQPVRRPALPRVKNASWCRNPIDRFLLARLEEVGLPPSPEAGRRELLRRLSYGLTGLPPTPEAVEELMRDPRPDAVERAVERLLASPAFGEKWARHWLDVARYGESDGFERDLPRYNAWPYRDWVARAFNADLPYTQFARLQLAGDVLHPGDPEALAATGLLTAGPHDIVIPVAENMRNAMRQDELEDITGTVAQAFLGLTFHCARCHDHKFDPVSQKDYYRLASALSGVGHGERALPDARRESQLAQARKSRADAEAALEALEAPARKAVLARAGKPDTAPEPLLAWDFTREADPEGLKGGARRDEKGLHLDGKGAYFASPPLPVSLREKTIQAWVRPANLTQRGGGVLSVQTLDGQYFDAIVLGEQELGRWMAGSNGFARTRSFGGPAEVKAALTHVAITYATDGTVTCYRDGRPYGKPYRTTVQAFEAGKAQVVFGLRHSPAGGNRMLAGTITRAMLHPRALTQAEVAACAGHRPVLASELLAELSPAQREEHQRLNAALAKLRSEEAKLSKAATRKVFANTPVPPGVTRLLLRGDVRTPGELVGPDVPDTLARYLPPTGLKPNAPEGQRRVALADWVASEKSPLFARVMANRLWHHHFGRGLVESPSDLGFNGGKPSHPELLDWLASELVSSGWSLKHLHRLIVTSAAYRQASRPRPEAVARDAESRLLWRYPPRRLDAEELRDGMLAISGALDREVGGPPYLDFKTYFFKGTQFYDPLEDHGRRRSLYRMWARGGRSPFLDTFDCPDPSASTPRRQATVTPLQALSLMNNPLVFHLAGEMAARIRREAGTGEEVERAFRLAYQRPPTEPERRLVGQFLDRHGLEALCRVLFNSAEMSWLE
jgi:hypothetical protein